MEETKTNDLDPREHFMQVALLSNTKQSKDEVYSILTEKVFEDKDPIDIIKDKLKQMKVRGTSALPNETKLEYWEDIFNKRETVLKHLQELCADKIIEQDDILALFRFAIKH